MPSYNLATLENVNLALYEVAAGTATRTRPWGSPGNPLFIGKWHNKVRISQRREEILYQPSGWRFPRRQQIHGNYRINLEGVHVFEDGQDGAEMFRNRLGFMDVVAYSDDLFSWRRWFFYGVTAAELEFMEGEVEMNTGRSFDAWFVTPDSGTDTAPPAV